jgi:hypothetical protein
VEVARTEGAKELPDEGVGFSNVLTKLPRFGEFHLANGAGQFILANLGFRRRRRR